jgi:glutamate synthase domain-containing protein 2
MDLWAKSNDVLGTVNRGDPTESGLCSLCMADCKGRCETWTASIIGRELLYPRNFGKVTAGSKNTTHIGVSYNSLRIQGRLYGAEAVPEGKTVNPDDCLFPNVNLETEFGAKKKTRCKLPLMTGALGSTFVAARYWNSLAVGCAISGIPIVIGENVVGIDKNAELKDGRIIKAPELDRRIEKYFRYSDGYGAIFVQMNVEDTRNGVAEYLIEKYGNRVVLELKWGQGAKCIGGEIQIEDLDYALSLKKRGYLVDPDPEDPEVQKAFKAGAIKHFARHSRLGFTDQPNYEKVSDSFMSHIEYLRRLGFERITLKTGSYTLDALALAIKLASEAELDLLTIDGSGGGTGMSPWNMMEHWGIPSIILHSKAYEYATTLARKGKKVVDLSFAGGFAREDHIFKALALGSPFTKLVCMGRALMIPGFVGSNIEGVLHPERKEEVYGNWDELPSFIKERGNTPEEIFEGYYLVEEKLGIEEAKNVPYGAIAMVTLLNKLSAGLQQLLAGARKFSVKAISRNDIASANRETEEVTGIKFIGDAYDELAKSILEK